MPDIQETNDAAGSTATSYTLGIGEIAYGRLSLATDTHDWYRVDLVAGQTYSFAMTGINTNNVTDPYLRLYGANGTTLVAQNDDGLPGGNSIFTYAPTQSGTYYLDAGSYNNLGAGTYGLTVALGTRPSFDIQMGAGVIDTDYSWGATPGSAASVSWGFRQSAATYSAGSSNISTFSQVSPAEMAAIQTVLTFCADVCNITFSRVNPNGYTDSASILYGNYTDRDDGAGAFAYYPGSTAPTSQAGDVWLNTASVSTTSLPFGSYSFETILHETMHTLGLSHPGVYNATPGQTFTYQNSAQFAQDSNQYSAMSYFDESGTGASFQGYPATPMLLDIYALQQIYGANTGTRTGDTVYGFGSNAGAVYDFAQGNSRGIAIWDAGGTDTINASGYSVAQLIDLRAGSFSNIGGKIANVSIALGVIVENAVGGSGDDRFIGNSANNSLSGGAGIDTVVFAGHHGNYAYNIATLSQYTVADQRGTGHDGTDTLGSIESLQFTDGVFTPIVGGLTFTLTDTDGSRLWDSIVSTFDNFGSLASQTVNNDNGTRAVTTYDTAGPPAWTWTTTAYDPNGNVVSRVTENDNGSHVLTFYDVPNTYAFASATITFNADWFMTTLSGLRDNGSAITSINEVSTAYDTLAWLPTPYDADLGGTPVDTVLIGGGHEDILYGHGGNDTIDGAGGDDILAGGFGDDLFQFHPGEADGDVVIDFNSHDESDLLEFIGYGAGATLSQTDASHLRVDYNGAASHDIIVLANQATIHSDDFFFA